jgi:hypothetical protein
MFCLNAVVVHRSSTDLFLWCYSLPRTDVCVLLARGYTCMIAFSPCLCSLYLGEVLCLECGGCETISYCGRIK